MNATIRFIALTVALTGLVSSSFSSASDRMIPSHLAAISSGPGPLSLPIPGCDPSAPACGGGSITSPSF